VFGADGYIGRSLRLEMPHYAPAPEVIPVYDVAQCRAIRDTVGPDDKLLHLASPRKTIKATTLGGLGSQYISFIERFTDAVLRGVEISRALGIPGGRCMYFASQSMFDECGNIYSQCKALAAKRLDSMGWNVVYPGTVFGYVPYGPIRGDTVINKLLLRAKEGRVFYCTRARRKFVDILEVLKWVREWAVSGTLPPAYCNVPAYRLDDLMGRVFSGFEVDESLYGNSLKGAPRDATEQEYTAMSDRIRAHYYRMIDNPRMEVI
jgi:hypothetical protein